MLNIRRSLGKLFYHHTVFVLSALLCLGMIGAWLNMSRLANNLVTTQATQSATLYAQAIEKSRTLYSSEAVSRIKDLPEVTISSNYQNQAHAIPVPSTFLIELGAKISETSPGMSVRLFSDYPFPQRQQEGGPKDRFEQQALRYLRQHPQAIFTRSEVVNGHLAFRYAQADIMRASCVACHNTHPDSPKRNWKVGDVRGVLEIMQPLDAVMAQSYASLRETSVMLAGIAALGIVGLTLVVSRLRQTSKELELRVIERTSQLQETNHQLALEQEKSDRLLLSILPEPIACQLKEGQNNIADGFADVTVLFADIVNFTPLATRVSPVDLVALLNRIFSVFDHLTEQHGVEKIKTIGDAYMVVGGIPTHRPDHAQAIADMALAMQAEIQRINCDLDEPLDIRIGINTGPVVAGVIGTKKFIYDLWGDAVNIASRMESSGLPGRIQVTETTYNHLKDEYQLEGRSQVEIKGKGIMQTYWLVGRKAVCSQI